MNKDFTINLFVAIAILFFYLSFCGQNKSVENPSTMRKIVYERDGHLNSLTVA